MACLNCNGHPIHGICYCPQGHVIMRFCATCYPKLDTSIVKCFRCTNDMRWVADEEADRVIKRFGSEVDFAASTDNRAPISQVVEVRQPSLSSLSLVSVQTSKSPKLIIDKKGSSSKSKPVSSLSKEAAAAIKLQRAFRLARRVNTTLLKERVSRIPITQQRQKELIKLDSNYLSELYGLRVISSMTGHEHESDLLIGHQYSTSYLRDAYDKIWGSLRGNGKLIGDVIEKIRKKKGLVENDVNFWLINSKHALKRLSFLSVGKVPLMTEPPKIIGGEPGLYVIAYKLSSLKFKKPWDTESPATNAQDIFKEYLKFVGATPSSYQMYKFLRAEQKKGISLLIDESTTVEPKLSQSEDFDNHDLLSELLSSKDFKTLSWNATLRKPLWPLFDASTRLLRGLDSFGFKVKFRKGVLVRSALESLANVVKALVFYSKHAERCRRLYDLLLDEIFLITAAVRPYPPEAITEREAAIQDVRIPTLKAMLSYKKTVFGEPGPYRRVIHPAWSGMDALTTALEAAFIQSGTEVQLIGAGDQATYFEVGCVLASQGKLSVVSMREDIGDDIYDDSITYPAVLMATMNPSTPEHEGPSPRQIVEVVWKRYNRLRRPITLIIDTTIQSLPKVDPVHQLDELVEQLGALLYRGQLQLIMARSYQKYQALGSGKFMGGCTTLIHSQKLTKSAKFLSELDSSTFRSLDETQFFTHILKHAAEDELHMVQVAAKNATFLSTELMPHIGNRGTAHVKGLPFAFKTDATKWIQRLAIAEMDSFGLVVSSYLDLTFMGAMRLNPGQESRGRMIEKFYAAGHLWGTTNTDENRLDFGTVVFQIRSILTEVDAAYTGARDEEAHDPRFERLPFTLSPRSPPNRGPLPDPDTLAKCYRCRTGKNGGTDLDHVLASYLSLIFRFCRDLSRSQNGSISKFRAILMVRAPEKDFLSKFMRNLFERGLMKCVSPEMRAELSEHWLRLLIETPPKVISTEDFKVISKIAGPAIARYGAFTPWFVRKILLSEAEVAKQKGNRLAELVEDFLTGNLAVVSKDLSKRSDLLSLKIDGPSEE